MKAVIPDKRRHSNSNEERVICSQCSFPEIVVESDVGKVKCIAYAEGPVDGDAALDIGWTETELGLICPICTGVASLVAREEGGASISVGIGGMATALAVNIAESQGEQFDGQISEDDVTLPDAKPDVTTVVNHTLSLKPDLKDGAELPSGVAVCNRCAKTWRYKVEGEEFVTETPYDSTCAFVPSVVEEKKQAENVQG